MQSPFGALERTWVGRQVEGGAGNRILAPGLGKTLWHRGGEQRRRAVGAWDSCNGGGEGLVSEMGLVGKGGGGTQMGPELSGAGGAQDLSWILLLQQSGAAAPGPRFAPLQVGVLGPQ